MPSPGRRYRAAGRNVFGRSSTAIWEFECVSSLGPGGVEFARLVLTNDRTEFKLVSLTALANRNLYEPV